MPFLQDANCRSLEIAFSFFSFFLFCFFSFLLPCTAAININEINCNPENQTYADEYIEIYGYAGLDLENFTICDSNKCNSLIKYKAENSSYSLITTNQSNYKDINVSVYFVNSTRIGNGLNNDGDCVYLYYQDFLIDVVCYSGTIQKGNSWQLFNGSWQKCSLSPGSGSENVCESQGGSQGQNQSENQSQEEFSIFYPSAILNKERPFVFVIDAANKSRLYDVKIDITSQDGKRLSEVWNENAGDWQSTYYYVNNMNLSNKSFILKINGNFTGDALAEVKIKDKVSYFFQVKVVDYALSGEGGEGGEGGEVSGEGSAESQIKILDLPNEAGCEESIKVKLRVYRGNTRKYAIYLYAFDKEKGREVSERSIFYASTKYVNYTLTIPIKLKAITESKSYWIVAEGLDERDEEKIFIHACQSNKTQSSQPSQSSRSESSKSSKTSKTEQNKESKRTFYFDTFDVSILDISFDGNKLRINAEIRNGANERNFFVWSYVEQHGACVSCKVSKEENAKQISIAENDSVELSLENNLSKTSKTSEVAESEQAEFEQFEQAELLVKLGVMPEDETSSELSFVFLANRSATLPSTSPSSLTTTSKIFESGTIKQSKATSYLLIATFLLACALIIFEKEI